MKIIFLCYNYLTLYKAIYNIENTYRNCNCVIVYRTSVSEIPKNLNKSFNTIEIKFNESNLIKLLRKYVNEGKWIFLIKKTIKVIKKEVAKDKFVRLVVFKDNSKMESTFIEKFKEFTNNEGNVILIEEGIGLYEKLTPRPMLGYKSKLLQRAFGLSKFFLNNYPQGYNPLVDTIVCSDVEKFRLQKSKEFELIEQKNIFSFENSRFFIENILGYDIDIINKYSDFKFIYLTQPLKEIGVNEDDERRVLQRICEKSDLSVLIKRHPRDNKGREYINGTNIFEFEDKFNSIPFECIYSIMHKPIIITYYSSVYKNIIVDNKNAKVILLYKFMNNKRLNDFMLTMEKGYDERIFIPNSMEELDNMISGIVGRS